MEHRSVKKLTQEKINSLRGVTAQADAGDLGLEFEENVPAELREDIQRYCKRFAKPRDGCLGCGEHMGGFTWGLVHGQGHCRKCGWPATLYHFIRDRDGKEIAVVRGVLLQAHPDGVSIRGEGEK